MGGQISTFLLMVLVIGSVNAAGDEPIFLDLGRDRTANRTTTNNGSVETNSAINTVFRENSTSWLESELAPELLDTSTTPSFVLKPLLHLIGGQKDDRLQLTAGEWVFRHFTSNNRSGAETSDKRPIQQGIRFTDDVQYFPAAPQHKLVVANEAPTATTKPAPLTTIPTAAAPSAPFAVTPPAAPLSKQRRQRRAKWSEALQAPAALTIDPAEKITLGELLERIRKQHGLPVRVDLAHVLPMTAMAEMTTARLTRKSPTNATVKAPAAFGVFPFGVYQTYSAEPVSPPVYYSSDTLPPAYIPATPTYDPVSPGTPVLPPAEPQVPIQTRKPVAAAEETGPVSAVKAQVLGEGTLPVPVKLSPVTNDPEDTKGNADESAGKNEASQAIQAMLAEMLSAPVDVTLINQPEATVEDVVRQAFDRSFPLQALLNASISEEIPMLASLSRATEWDLLIQDDGVLLTTRLNANLHKETRVYSTKALEKSAGLKAEDVARVLTRTVRPWSWKKNFPEAVTAEKTGSPQDRSKTGTKTGKAITLPKINFDLSSLISAVPVRAEQQLRLVNNEDGTTSVTTEAKPETVELTEEQLELLGRAWDGLFQGAVSSLQVIYHADPPTGVIEVLPGMLVISQSQGAHREIADLLEQLGEPEN